MTSPWLTDDPNWKPRTYNEVLADYNFFTDEQRSLAWSPEPPYEKEAASDCRRGGACGLNFNEDSRRAKWRRARFRFRREEEDKLAVKKTATVFDRSFLLGGVA